MKLNFRRVAIFLLLLAISVGFGFGFDAVATVMEKNRYPIREEFADQIRACSEEFGVPEAIIWATVCVESGFVSDAVGKDGGIGLMQLTPKDMEMIQTDILGEEPQHKGFLYYPQANLRCGTAYLSWLYQRYGVWETVFAAYSAGYGTVDAWLKDPELITPQGTLSSIPDAEARDFVSDATEAFEAYTKLYFESIAKK